MAQWLTGGAPWVSPIKLLTSELMGVEAFFVLGVRDSVVITFTSGGIGARDGNLICSEDAVSAGNIRGGCTCKDHIGPLFEDVVNGHIPFVKHSESVGSGKDNGGEESL